MKRPSLDLIESRSPVSRAIKKKGSSWINRTRSLGRKRSSSQLTKASSLRSSGYDEEARDTKDTRRDSCESYRNPPASPVVQEDADDILYDSDCDESYINSSDIHNDRSLYKIAPLEKKFITNTLTRLQVMGYGDEMDVYSMGILLRDICAYEKPFEPLSLSDYDKLHHKKYQPQQKVFNINPLWARIEHSLSNRCDNDDVLDRPMTLALVKGSICSVLKDMNIKVIHDVESGSDARQNGTWGNPPFMNSWNSLSYCHCSLF